MSESPRTVTADSQSAGKLGVSSLVLLAVLLAAGFILNFTVGNALAIVGIKPQFIIAAYALAILLTNANAGQAAVFGLISAAVIQLTTSIPGLNFFTELTGALTMCGLCKLSMKVGGRDITPLVATFVTTLVSGLLFAVCGNLIMGAAIGTVVVKLPIVLGTACFNAIVVQALVIPLRKVLKR
ncbi:MAG: hypothetical protein LKG38_00555 [Atopobiaceae bacterium]|jgi:hypothetical protein|nr:hypothetical protein [Atopobiaceae bacterium]MCH4120277.1 hypothetical protein [Atopobiaceae bacterium]MCI1317818.1 hypothetical protein [Atopobiaceae bacterium]MCI1388929.1 hypothetical protein [Atopobiaceae bacterium]MCI1431837.1 hypothetical protein [Atopobiaceae bacterium]